MSSQQPPDIKETGRVGISQKHAWKWVLFALLGVAVFAFWRSTVTPASAVRPVMPASTKAPVDNRTPKEMNANLEREARDGIQNDAAAAQRNGGIMYKVKSMYGNVEQPTGWPRQEGYTPYQHSQSTGQNPAEARKAAAAKALADEEERKYKASKAPLLVHSFEEKESPTAASPLVQKAALAAPSPIDSRPTVEQVKKPLYTLYRGHIIDTVLVNGLNAAAAGPLKTLVTTDVYDRDRTVVLIKKGSEFHGTAHRIAEQGQERVAVSMERLLRSDGFSQEFEEMPGLQQSGETALKDKVNHHYPRTFIVTGAMAALGGLAMMGTNYGYGIDSSEMFQQQFGAQMARSTSRILDYFVRLPWDVTVRPGWRVEVFLMKDLEIPAQEKL